MHTASDVFVIQKARRQAWTARFGASARTAGEVLGAVIAADPGDQNRENADYRTGKQSSDGDTVSATVNTIASRASRAVALPMSLNNR